MGQYTILFAKQPEAVRRTRRRRHADPLGPKRMADAVSAAALFASTAAGLILGPAWQD
jgi:hypothetical protein